MGKSKKNKWHNLETVDIPTSRHVYKPSEECELPKVVETQVIASRDPRLSPSLPERSVYSRTFDVRDDSAFMEDDSGSFNSEDWYMDDNESESDEKEEPKNMRIQVHVNPKFLAKFEESGVPTVPDENDLTATDQGNVSPPIEKSSSQSDAKPATTSDSKDMDVLKSDTLQKMEVDESPASPGADTRQKPLHVSSPPIERKSHPDSSPERENKRAPSDQKISRRDNIYASSKSRSLQSPVVEKEDKLPELRDGPPRIGSLSYLSRTKDKENSTHESAFRPAARTVKRSSDKDDFGLSKFKKLSSYAYKTMDSNCSDKQHPLFEEVFKSNRQDLMFELEDVCLGRDVKRADPYKHFKSLSLSTQLESAFHESPMVKRLHIENLREWMIQKPLDALISGHLAPPKKPSLILHNFKIDDILEECIEEFRSKSYQIMKGDIKPDMTNVFPITGNKTEDTVDTVFRQVTHYLDFLSEKSIKEIESTSLQTNSRDRKVKNEKPDFELTKKIEVPKKKKVPTATLR